MVDFIKTNEEILDRVEIEGLEYAFLDYFNPNNLPEPFKSLAKKFSEIRQEIENELQKIENIEKTKDED